MKPILVATAAAALAVMSAGTAEASLIGDSVNVVYYYPDLSTPLLSDTVVVGAGSEVVCPGSFNFCDLGVSVDIDIVADSVTVRWGQGNNAAAALFNGFSFEDLDFGPGLELASVALDTNMAGVDAGDLSFGANFARLNIQGTSFASDSFFALNFTTRQVAVPEPGALGLLGFGLLGLGLAAWRRSFGRV